MSGGCGSERVGSAVLAGLLRVCEPPSAALSLFVHRVGAVAAWDAVLARRAPRAVLSATAARTANVTAAELMSRAEQDVAVAARCGARVIGETDAEWPADAVSAFAGAVVRGVRGAGPPFALYVRGRALAGLPGRGVTIVGSRASSAYGQRVAGEMAHELASRGMSVISGAAFGIDTAAHRAALQVAGQLRWRCCTGRDAGDGRGVGVRDRPGVSGGEPGVVGRDRRGAGRWSVSTRRGRRRRGTGSWCGTG